MAPVVDMAGLRQAIADAGGGNLPLEMQTSPFPLGGRGFVGDIVPFFIAFRIKKGEPPLFVFHHREIRHRRFATFLAAIQLLSCTVIAIYTLFGCSKSDPSHSGVLLIGSARTVLAFYHGYCVLSVLQKTRTPEKHEDTPRSAERDEDGRAAADGLGKPEPATHTELKDVSTNIRAEEAPPPFST